MAEKGNGTIRETLDGIYASESRRILASLIRLLGDFDLAEDALHDAFAAALEHWPRDGVPANPRAWLVSTGRFKAIDRLRRCARFGASLAHLKRLAEPPDEARPGRADEEGKSKMTACGSSSPAAIRHWPGTAASR